MKTRGPDRIGAGVATAVIASLVLWASAVTPAPRPADATLTVFAAASLTDAFGELAHQFERAHPGVTVRLAFAGSQQLVAQLAAGARADVFAAADTPSMEAAAHAGRLDGDPVLFARNRLAVIVPATNPARIDRLDQLTRPGVKLVVCATNVPAGRYARELLKRLEGAALLPKGGAARVLANVVSEEENVKSVLTKVQLGEADAGIVYVSDVTPALSRYVRTFEIPAAAAILASYPIVVVKDAKQPAAAQEFVELVLSAEGQKVLASHGLLPAADAAK